MKNEWIRTQIDGLKNGIVPETAELDRLLNELTDDEESVLFEEARKIRDRAYGPGIFIRGLIEFTNVCRNDCLYCGIRRSNREVSRYRLSEEDILSAAEYGYDLGFRTFVLQGGEDPWWTDERLSGVVKDLSDRFPDCAVTLSVGERSHESYEALKEAGAARFLLRHETADPTHYAKLHPPELTLAHRISCLKDLKALGYQTGAGFMTGSPGQGTEQIRQDLIFLTELSPEMCGIGPFLPHSQTPLRDEAPGDPRITLRILAMVRLLLPEVLLPATTALSTADNRGIERGLSAGANVVMVNLTPEERRKNYQLYDGKQIDTAENGLEKLRTAADSLGMQVICGRGDFASA